MLFRSDRKSTRLNSSHTIISYAVFCLKKKQRGGRERRGEGGGRRAVGVLRTHADRRPPPQTATPRPPGPSSPLTGPTFLFFFKNPGPTDFSPFPLPAPLPI